MAAVAVAAGVIVANLAAWLDLPQSFQTLLLAPISAAALFSAIHWLFAKRFWRLLCRWGQFPDVSGRWQCDGRTMDGSSVVHQWEGEVSIEQDWERIRVTLATDKSTSSSCAASLLPQNDGRWLLMYSYKNQADIGHPELRDHYGYCEIRFSRDGTEGDGNYFNAPGRGTCGRMTLTRLG